MSYNYMKETADEFRDDLLEMETNARTFIDNLKDGKAPGEVIAQATLAMRHIEDARMRYGKVIQYAGDGVSIYDK